MAGLIDVRKLTQNILTLARQTAAKLDAAVLSSAKAYTDSHTLGIGVGTFQPLDATLTSLAGMDASAGVVEETAADVFTKRAIGVGTATSLPTRADADARYMGTDATLTALAALDASAGLLEQTGADTFTKRAIGVGATTSIPTRANGDARWDALGAAAAAIALSVQRASNLSDLANAGISRTNLGLGALAVKSTVIETDFAFTDITTADVSITKHGLMKKLPNDATLFYDGTGAFSSPSTAILVFPALSGAPMVRYNASLSAKTLSNHGYVTKWFDLSANVRDTFTNTTNPPKWLDAAFLSKFPGLFFNLGQKLMINTMPQLLTPLACTIVFVGQNFESSGNSHIYNYSGNPIGFGSGTPLDFMYNGTLPSAHAMSAESGSLIPASYASKQPVVGIHVYNGASSVQSINNLEETKSPGTGSTGTTNNFTIGSDSSTGVGGATGQSSRMILAEICVFNYAMNSTDRASLLAYYKSLYGMSFL